MGYLKRILLTIPIVLLWMVGSVMPILADPSGNVTNFVIRQSDTSLFLSWQTATGATSYIIRYSTDTYPATPADGLSAYNGTGFSHNLTGLTPGTTYFFSAWGYDGVGYSPAATLAQKTTYPVGLPSGGTPSPVPVIPLPTIPATANATANISGFQLEPFSSIIRYFVTDNATSPGGVGMPENNMWEVLAIGVIVMGGAGTYIKSKNFFIAYFMILIFTIFFVGLHLVQWYLVPIEIAIGLGVWAIEKSFQ